MQKHGVPEPAAAIERITEDRCLQAQMMGGMQPELVRSSGERREFNAGGSGVPGKFAPPGYTPFAVQRVIDLVRPVVRIQAKAEIDGT